MRVKLNWFDTPPNADKPMADEKISLEDDEMQELAQLVAEALARGDSRESVIADLSENGMSEDDSEEFVSLIESQLYQIDTGPAQHAGGSDGGMGWLMWISVIVGINVLSQIFNWGFVIY